MIVYLWDAPGPRESGGQDLSAEGRALSAGLASRRRAAGLTQARLAALAICSVNMIGHAETGRLEQGPRFWDRADTVLGAHGELLRLYGGWVAARDAG